MEAEYVKRGIAQKRIPSVQIFDGLLP
jgi:hypothetical protein